jgi:hypothetical protein
MHKEFDIEYNIDDIYLLIQHFDRTGYGYINLIDFIEGFIP